VTELLVALAALLCLLISAFGSLLWHKRLPFNHLEDDTITVVRLVTNIFVVMTSLALGLMLNSAKNTLETNNRNIHTLATDLILLDRTIREMGPVGDDAHQHLVEYVETALKDSNILEEDPKAGAFLDAAGASLRAIHASDDVKTALSNDARELYRQVVQQRWVLVDASSRTIPTPLMVMLIAWLSVIFAGFGYRAPSNPIVAGSFFIAALFISGALYLIFDMDTPATGLIKVSNGPFERALTHFQR
jgi:hypothetical protein